MTMPPRRKPHPLLTLWLCLLLLGAPLLAMAHPRPQDPDWAAVDAYVEAQRSGARIPGVAFYRQLIRGSMEEMKK